MPIRSVNKYKILTVVSLAAFSVAYYHFSNYRPKANAELKEVKSAKYNKNVSIIPHPLNAVLISSNDTSEGQVEVFEINKSPESVMYFYETVLLERDWEIDKTSKTAVFHETTYKNKEYEATISASRQSENSDKTIITVNITRR